MNWNNKENKQLIEALLSLETDKEAERFLRDLMTEGEIKEFSNRFSTALMLSNKIPYSTIEKKTGFSSTTVASVSKWLNNGMDGYKLMLNRISHHAHASPVRKGVVL